MTDNQTPVSNLIGGGALKAFISLLTEGEKHKGDTTVGSSKYLVFLPTIQQTVGLEIRITAHPNRKTKYEAFVTDVSNDSNKIVEQMYRGQMKGAGQ